MRRFLHPLYALMVMGLFGTPALAADQPACDPYALESLAYPVPPQTPGTFKAAYKKRDAGMPEPDIMLVGDSFLDLWDPYLAESFPKRSVWNFAIGGDTVQNVTWRYQTLDRPKFKPKTIILLVGTNNLFVPGTPSCAVASGIKSLVNAMNRDWPAARVLLVALPPRGPDFRNFDEERKKLNGELESFADSRANVAFVKLDEAELTCGNNSKPALDRKELACHPEQLYGCTNYTSDNGHLNEAGFVLLKKYIREASTKKFGSDITG